VNPHEGTGDNDHGSSTVILAQGYLAPFAETILPYELITTPRNTIQCSKDQADTRSLETKAISQCVKFQRFNAPLSLFLRSCSSDSQERLYIAQAQVVDLPKQLQDDLPVPKLVKEAGKGDIYDSNIWMGIPPTYTPLHKDPNPNLFVQLASSKAVRLFKPSAGAALFREVQSSIREFASSNFRGEEMMEGPERAVLEDMVWGERTASKGGFAALVGPGDALFIPKGWWHSFKSIGTSVNGSVNWWFR
jgi:hypothetical protein